MQDSVYIGIKAHRRRRTVHIYNDEGHSELQSKFWFRNRNAKSANCKITIIDNISSFFKPFMLFINLLSFYWPWKIFLKQWIVS